MYDDSIPSPKHPGGRPPLFATPQELQDKITSYFQNRKDEEKPNTIQGLASALGMCRDTLNEYSKKGEFSAIVKQARDYIIDNVETMLFTGQPAAGPIFWLKNNAGYADRQEIAHTGADGQPLTVIVHRGADLRVIDDSIPDAELAEE